jgi:PAS domain S-box-containing protein
MKGKDRSIQQKLMRVVMLTSGTVLFMTCAAFFAYEVITYRDITKRELSTLGQIVASNSTAALAFDSKEDAAEVLNGLRAEKHIVAACLYDTAGKVFSTYPAGLSAQNFPTQLGIQGYVFRKDYLEGFQPVIQNNNRLGTLYLKSDMQAMYSRLRLYAVIASVFIIVSFLFAYLLSRRLQKAISKPILSLAQTARMVSDRHDYTVRATKWSQDELGVLTDAFNHMLTQIKVQNDEITSLNQNLERKVKERTLELQEANQALVQQNELIETIIDSSVDVIAVMDRDYRYLIINKAVNKVYSFGREQLIGKKLLDVFPQLKDAGMINDLKKAFSGEAVHNVSYRSTVSGRYFENFYIPLKNKHDAIDRVLIIGHDITDIMQASEKLKELNVELEKSNRDLEQFAYVASHDLQEPLRKIQTFAELSERNIEQPDALRRYLEKINSSASRMTNLIKAVLNYSRISKVDSAFVPIDLNSVVKSIETDLELLIEEKKAAIQVEHLPQIEGIPLQINQLFLNLFTNSLKFTTEAPVIRITSRTYSGTEAGKTPLLKNVSTYVEVVFKDNGIGFEQKYADRVFSIFQRLHPLQDYAGTGIGLALCKKIVENHGGMITVESEPGKGTAFFIYLPLPSDTGGELKFPKDKEDVSPTMNP